jgi:hypothetical protein
MRKCIMRNITAVATLMIVALVPGARAQQPTPAPAPTAAPAPTGFIPSSKLGLYVYPAKGQTPEQQNADERACYTWAVQQTGFDPAVTAPPNTDSAAAASKAKAADATQGAAVAGAAKGAVAGVAIGAVAGDAGTGAAVGATAGAMAGRRAKKQAEAGAAQQGAQQAQAQAAAQMDNFKKAETACLKGKDYSVD